MSLAKIPKDLTENPLSDAGHLLSDALRRVRITGGMQYCFMPSGDWTTDATPAPYKPHDAIGFHILVGGSCWLDFEGKRINLAAGDIAAFPFGTGHMIGAGEGGRPIDPGADLPPAPWVEVPVLEYGDKERQVRMLCGYMQCAAMDFAPFRQVLPKLIHVRTSKAEGDDWLAQTIRQVVVEVDAPKKGGVSVLERLTEVLFIEVLRRQFLSNEGLTSGWLAAAGNPALGRCLMLIHAAPCRDWTLAELARESGLSRTVLSRHFDKYLDMSPMRYLRDWRLYLASEQLSLTERPVADIADEIGYESVAAFSRAFSRRMGTGPAEWRRRGPTRHKSGNVTL